MNKTTRIVILLVVAALATGLGTGYSYFWKTRKISEEINKEHNSNISPESTKNSSVHKSSILENQNTYSETAPERTSGENIGKSRVARKSQTPLKLAMEKFHGSDWVGADGIWRKAGFDLAYLHEISANGTSDETLLMQIRELRPHWFLNSEGIVVDVISHPDADLIQLEKSLKDLGLRQTYTFGGVVTGFLPTQVIPEISKLDGIVYIHPSRLLASN